MTAQQTPSRSYNDTWPNGWNRLYQKQRRAPTLVAILFAGCALLAALQTEDSTNADFFLRYGAMAGASVFGVLAVLTYVTTFGTRKRRAAGISLLESTVDTPATFLAQCPKPEYVRQVLGIIVVTWATAAFALPWLRPDITFDTPGYGVVMLVAGVIIVCYLPTFASYFIRNRKPMGIGLTPEGVYRRSRFGCCFFTWDSIDRVRADDMGILSITLQWTPDDRPVPHPEQSYLARFGWFRNTARNFSAAYFCANPGLVFRAIEFYHKHPEHRCELNTEGGLARIRTANFQPAIAYADDGTQADSDRTAATADVESDASDAIGKPTRRRTGPPLPSSIRMVVVALAVSVLANVVSGSMILLYGIEDILGPGYEQLRQPLGFGSLAFAAIDALLAVMIARQRSWARIMVIILHGIALAAAYGSSLPILERLVPVLIGTATVFPLFMKEGKDWFR